MAKGRNQSTELSIEPLIRAKNPRPKVEKLIKSIEANETLRDILVSVIAEDATLLAAIKEKANENSTQEKPPVARGRRIEQEEYIEGQWLRLEYVPCGSSRCKKEPDEHGPYWYSYKLLGGRWRAVYFGRKRPKLRQQLNEKRVKTLLTKLETTKEIDDQAIKKLGQAVVDLSSVKGAEAKELRVRAATLISDEEQRRETHLRKAHRQLLEKVLSGKKLNRRERASFDEVCQLLLSYR